MHIQIDAAEKLSGLSIDIPLGGLGAGAGAAAAAEIAPVTSIDGRIVGDGTPGEVSAKIHAKFHEIVEGKDPKYDKWLDYVN